MSAPPRWLGWAVAGLLSFGALMTSSVVGQPDLPLRAPLSGTAPERFAELAARDVALSEAERRVAGVNEYLMRIYERSEGAGEGGPAWASLYVGYYESQTRGRAIHSPKNCMPGAGWEAMDSSPVTVSLAGGGSVVVNRYLLVNEEEEVLVLYWYQGRGRVVASEYQAKLELLRDAAISRRSDEALVRIVVPVIGGDEEAALEAARRLATDIVPRITEALPAA